MAGALMAQAALPLPMQPAPENTDPVALTILAEPQMALPLTEISRLYSLNRRITVLASFEDSRSQFDKLLEGESGDVVISSLPSIAVELRQRGMVDVYSHTSVATDKLVLAAQRSENLNDRRKLLDALKRKPLLLSDPALHVEGLYGQETMRYLFYNEPAAFEPRRFSNRSAMYNAISNGEGIGIMLKSEVADNQGIDLSFPISENSYPPVIYHGLVIAGENMPIGRDFLEFLKTSEVQQIFSRHGFSPR